MANGICSIDDCGTPIIAKGLCRPHYDRWRRRGDATAESLRLELVTDECTLEGCEAPHIARGFCGPHYYRFKKYGDPLQSSERYALKECGAVDCTDRARRNGLCDKHSQRMKRNGSLDPLPSTRVCSGPECDRMVDAHQGGGLCRTHYAMRYRGTALAPIGIQPQKLERPKVCTYEGCENPHKARGYCKQHAQILKEGKPLRPLVARLEPGPCKLLDCEQPRIARGFCAQHWSALVGRFRRYGLDADEAADMYAAQDRRCAGCSEALPLGDLVVDHDHSCECNTRPGNRCGGCVRGLICRPCNFTLGHARDNADRLRGLAAYLDRLSGEGRPFTG